MNLNFRSLRLPLAGLAGLFLLTGCPDKKAAETAETNAPAEARLPKAPAFSADSAYAFTAKQVAFGPRVPNTKAHIATGNWLVAKLKSYGLKVMEQPFEAMTFDGTNIHARNIIAQYQPQAARRVAVFGHWDTRPFADNDKARKNAPLDGASDGASGVAVALEMARIFGQLPDSLAPNVGIDFILVDAEDWGYDAGHPGKAQKPARRQRRLLVPGFTVLGQAPAAGGLQGRVRRAAGYGGGQKRPIQPRGAVAREGPRPAR